MTDTKWINLINEYPTDKGIYKVLRLDYNGKIKKDYLLWTGESFQPLDRFTANEAHNINTNVTHWLKVNEPEPPFKEAESLIITTETFFFGNIDKILDKYKIEPYEVYGNALKLNMTDILPKVIQEIREDKSIISQGIYKNARRC